VQPLLLAHKVVKCFSLQVCVDAHRNNGDLHVAVLCTYNFKALGSILKTEDEENYKEGRNRASPAR
jgi:hypothetical protein